MDLNFFSGMDRKTFERGLRPFQKGYIPKKEDIIISLYIKNAYHRFHIFTDFKDGTTKDGWGIFYDIYDVIFYRDEGGDVLGGYGGESKNIYRGKEAHNYQFPNIYETWLRSYPNATPYLWKGDNNFYLNWNENPFEVK